MKLSSSALELVYFAVIADSNDSALVDKKVVWQLSLEILKSVEWIVTAGVKGHVNTPCLTNGNCTDANTVCGTSRICTCVDSHFVKNNQCGRIFILLFI